MENKDLWREFFLKHPFEDFSLNDKSATDGGWHSDSFVFDILLMNQQPSLIIEVGTWKGASAIHMTKIMLEQGVKHPLVICVDTWLGGVEHWDMPPKPDAKGWVDPTVGWTYKDLNWKNGRPDIYDQFMANVMNEGYQDYILPISQTSRNAYKLLMRKNIKADMIYIDASHEYADVIDDMNHYFTLVKPGGIMFGDDFHWSGVNKAVRKFPELLERDFQYQKADTKIEILEDNFWVVRKL